MFFHFHLKTVKLHLFEHLRLAFLPEVCEAADLVVPDVCWRGHIVTVEESVQLPVNQGDLGAVLYYFLRVWVIFNLKAG